MSTRQKRCPASRCNSFHRDEGMGLTRTHVGGCWEITMPEGDNDAKGK